MSKSNAGSSGSSHNRHLPDLRTAGAAITGTATGTGAAGAGHGLGHAADTGAESGEGGHLAPGRLMAFRTGSRLLGLA